MLGAVASKSIEFAERLSPDGAFADAVSVSHAFVGEVGIMYSCSSLKVVATSTDVGPCDKACVSIDFAETVESTNSGSEDQNGYFA